MKVALVHDWLTGMRGGEKVLEVLCEIFPDADLFTLVHIPGTVSGVIERRRIRTSFIQGLPGVRKRYRSYLPLFPMAVEGFDLAGYDLIVSSSHCVAKGVIPPPDALHISYIHTPMRYVWDKYRDYFGDMMNKAVRGRLLALFAHYLRIWDTASSSRVDHFIANSRHVAARVEKYYRREATVVYPPVDCGRFSPAAAGDYYLVVSAFAPYKRIDLAISAFNRTGYKLKVIGSAQDEKRLKRMAGPGIEFLGWKSDDEVAGYLAGCRALVFPGEEDFGIVPLEAMASGRPVIAFGKGGALETVVPLGADGAERGGAKRGKGGKGAKGGKGPAPTGIFFYEQEPASLIEATRRFEENLKDFDPEATRAHALKFDRKNFKEKLTSEIMTRVEEFKRRC